MALFIHKNNEQLGPFEEHDILAFLNEGKLSYQDLGWQEGMAEWKSLQEIMLKSKEKPQEAKKKSVVEQIAWAGRPSIFGYYFVFIIWIFFFPLILISIFGNNYDFSTRFCMFIFGITPGLYILKDKYSNKYTVTNKNISHQKGLLVKSTNQVRTKDVRSINVQKKGLIGFLGFGNLEVSSAATDKAEIVFKGLKKVEEIKKIVVLKQDEFE